MKWTCGRGYQLVGVGGVLGIEAVVESGNKRVDQTLLLEADLAGIELCGVHKEHCAHSQVEPKVEEVVPEKCAGVWPHEIEDACTEEEGGGGMGGQCSKSRDQCAALTAKDAEHDEQQGQHKSDGSPQHVLMEHGRDEDGGQGGNAVVPLAVEQLQTETHTQRESQDRESQDRERVRTERESG